MHIDRGNLSRNLFQASILRVEFCVEMLRVRLVSKEFKKTKSLNPGL